MLEQRENLAVDEEKAVLIVIIRKVVKYKLIEEKMLLELKKVEQSAMEIQTVYEEVRELRKKVERLESQSQINQKMVIANQPMIKPLEHRIEMENSLETDEDTNRKIRLLERRLDESETENREIKEWMKSLEKHVLQVEQKLQQALREN